MCLSPERKENIALHLMFLVGSPVSTSRHLLKDVVIVLANTLSRLLRSVGSF